MAAAAARARSGDDYAVRVYVAFRYDPGTATFTADGLIHDSKIIDLGHFTLADGKEGLEGVSASGTFNFTMGVGGEYVGRASFDRKSK